MKKFILFVVVLSAGLLAGCATQRPPLYHWGHYNDQVYSYFKGEPLEKQIQFLEKDLEEAKYQGEKLPPGFYAHLGLLYEKGGRGEAARAMFELEKQMYPESTVFINNLFNQFK